MFKNTLCRLLQIDSRTGCYFISNGYLRVTRIEVGRAKSQNSLLMHSLYAIADVEHGPELLKLYVEEMNDPNSVDTSKRAYQLQNIEKASAVNGGVQGNSPSSLANTTNAIRTVSDLFAAVKQKDANGNTVVSVEYPRGTRASKVLQDIRNYFENGAEPVVSDVSRFRYSDRDSAKTRTFKNGQNAKGEFIANVLIDLADSNSEWWTGRYNRGILGMSKSDDTEFRQFYQEILKRTKEKDEYGESDLTVEDSFTVQDGKGKEYVYVVKLDGYLHGVVLGKIDVAKHERAMKRYERSKEYGRPDADISRRTANARNEVERHSSRNSRHLTSDGNSGYGRVDSGSPKSHMAGNDEGESQANRKVPTVTDPDGALHQDRDSDSVFNRTLLANVLESVGS